MTFQGRFQIGKSGVTDGVIDSLLLVYKTHKHVRISALKSSGRDKASIKLMADDIAAKLAAKSDSIYDYKIIGFTMIMKKHPKLKTKN